MAPSARWCTLAGLNFGTCTIILKFVIWQAMCFLPWTLWDASLARAAVHLLPPKPDVKTTPCASGHGYSEGERALVEAHVEIVSRIDLNEFGDLTWT